MDSDTAVSISTFYSSKGQLSVLFQPRYSCLSEYFYSASVGEQSVAISLRVCDYAFYPTSLHAIHTDVVCVYLLSKTMSPAEMAEPIKMPFGEYIHRFGVVV